MALLNNLYIFVEDESVSNSIESSTHPVEKGMELTDNIRKSPTTISLKGKIVDCGDTKAKDILSKILKLQANGSLIKYSGRNIVSNMQIQSFNTSHPNTVWGGCEFDMELKEVRIAKSAYTAPKSSTKKKTTKTTKAKTTTEIKVGDTVVFKGGSVYVSSDAKKASATRGRSTCKVTLISNESWSVHKYHLVSKDGKNVYGWVDKSNIEVTGSKTKAVTSSGTQQTTKGTNKAVYHTVKSGETVYGLVTKNYKELGKSCQWVIDKNPSAFSKKGDARTLKVNAKLLMGYR